MKLLTDLLRYLPFNPMAIIDYLRLREFLALLILVAAISVVFSIYNSVLMHSDQQLNQLMDESAALRTQIEQLKSTQNRKLMLVQNTTKVLGKLDEFDNRFLKDITSGRLALVDEIHKLIRENGVELDSGISFKREEEKQQEKRIRKKDDDLSKIYPSIEARFKLSGQYSNLRGFIRDVESSKLFMVIEAIDLDMGEKDETQGGLSIDLKIRAYFQKSLADVK